ncbi:MAG: substrate-binding domain-containing protein, partial [Pseudomonadota bacterium]
MLSALKRLNVHVPNQIGVAGFGNFEVSRFSSPTISTVVIDQSSRLGPDSTGINN